MTVDPIIAIDHDLSGHASLRHGESLSEAKVFTEHGGLKYALVYIHPDNGDPRWATLVREDVHGVQTLATSMRICVEYGRRDLPRPHDWHDHLLRLMLEFLDANDN